jgi:anthranilate phosphoribosyltransferase
MTQHNSESTPRTEHLFAQYVRLLGKGKTGSRNLTYDEAKAAMTMILKSEVEPEQLGAFMMLMRYQEESGEELAGFVDATYDVLTVPADMPKVDLDWSSYAGKARRLPWFILSTWLLAENGITILMHGEGAHTANRIYTDDVLRLLNIPIACSFEEAGEHIQSHNFAYLSLHDFLPELARIMDLKWTLGLRSPVNTFTRLINPCRADCSMQGIHHPAYRDTHQEASLLLNQPTMAVLKGDGGETEWNPDMPNLVRSIKNKQAIEEEWQPLFPKRHVKDKTLDPKKLATVWRGEEDDEYGVGAILGTAAITLYTMDKADSHEAALEMAAEWWEKRNKESISLAS